MTDPELFPFHLVDLTQALDARTPLWPGDGPLRRETLCEGIQPNGNFCANYRLDLPEHAGTHADAPRHFDPQGATLEAVPIDQCVGPAVVIDASGICLADPDARIGTSDFETWIKNYGPPPPRPVVLISTGFARFWPDRARYLGEDASGVLHFPGLDGDAARQLALDWGARAVGIDTAGIDPGNSTNHPAHHELLLRGLLVLENLASLKDLPPRGFFVAGLPAKWGGASGGPVRVVALIPP